MEAVKAEAGSGAVEPYFSTQVLIQVAASADTFLIPALCSTVSPSKKPDRTSALWPSCTQTTSPVSWLTTVVTYLCPFA